MNTGDVGALEALFSQGWDDEVRITFDPDQLRFVATLVEACEDGGAQGSRRLVSASGATMVEALLQLELAYRNLLGISS